MGFLYLIFGICAIAVSIGKALAVNFGISKYLSKKSYKGKFKVIKTASISFGVGYILLALASLFIVTMVMDAIYSHIRFDELLQDFLSIFYMAIIGANYEFLDSPYGKKCGLQKQSKHRQKESHHNLPDIFCFAYDSNTAF